MSAANNGSGRGPLSPVNDEDWIDGALARWASDRDVYVPPGAAMAAANAALADTRAGGFFARAWKPTAIFGGSLAAALTGVLVLGPGPAMVADEGGAPTEALMAEADLSEPAAPEAEMFAEASVPELDPNMARLVGADSELAAIADDFPELDHFEDDILVTSHVFTLRPDEEPIY